jgi:CSLREA domain-containing protein/uncharacterized repeat protein (TIGR01451 family)
MMDKRLARLLLSLAIGLASAWLWLALLAPPAALGAVVGQTFIVNSAADVSDAAPGDSHCATGAGFCTLRAALQEANASPGADTIQLQANTTYLLSQSAGIPNYDGNLDISTTVTILGAGPQSTVIDGNGAVTGERVFTIITDTVVISGVTIENGRSPNAGGGLLNEGRLTIINAAILSNTVDGSNDWGGGIDTFGPLTVTNSLIRGNKTGPHNAYGGGIMDGGIYPLTVIDSIISDNTTTGTILGLGGGISGFGRIEGSTLSGNSAATGGGLYHSGAPLVIINSTLTGNRATGAGGGLYSRYGQTSLYNTTVTDNLANSDESGTAYGGGVVQESGGTFDFINSIIAGNNRVRVPGPFLDGDDCAGAVTAVGFDIMLSVASGFCAITGTPTIADPLLGPLQDNGGPTPTQALLPGSPAIDAGNPSGCTDDQGAPLATDQRGHPRPVFGGTALRCDIGAFEAAPDLSGSRKGVTSLAATPGSLLTYTLVVSNSSPLTASFALTDPLDAQVSLVSAPGLSGGRTLTGGGLLAGLAQVSYMVTVRVGQGAHGALANIARLSGDGFTHSLAAPLVAVGVHLWLPLVRR